MNRVKVYREEGTEEVLYTVKAGSWHVKTPADGGFWPFADSDASPRDVEQLIRKKWCGRYNTDPDDFSDHG